MLASGPLLCSLLTALQVTTVTAGGDGGLKTHVRGIDFAGEGCIGASALSSSGRHPGNWCECDEIAADPSRQYNGRIYDPGTGFHDYGARMYWPEIGRFISADTYGGNPANPASLNRYSYVQNNPYKYVDPDGKTPLIVAALAVAAAGGVGAAIGSYIDNGRIDWNQVGTWTSTGFLIGLTGGLSLAASGGAAATEAAAAAPAATAAPTVTVAEATTAGAGAAGAVQQLSAQAQRSIQSLQARLTEHVSKLEAYKANPDAFDNKGFLKNASEAVRQQIINGRIRHRGWRTGSRNSLQGDRLCRQGVHRGISAPEFACS